MASSENQKLNKVQSISSGLKELINEDISKKRFTDLLTKIETNKNEELESFFLENPHLLDTVELKALMIYFKFLQGKKVIEADISTRGAPAYLVKALTIKLQSIDNHFKKLKHNKANIHELKDLFPEIDLELDKEEKQEEIKYKLKITASTLEFDEGNFQERLTKVYKELSEIQEKIAKEENVSEKTCFHFKCCDCCIHTPPIVTALEFEYIKANVDIEQYKTNAQNNQKLHKAEFGTELEITDQDTQNKEAINPNFFSHRCPFLAQDDSCTIHEFRPFACRFYGLSTIDGISVQACNYYLEQYRLNNTELRIVLDSRFATALLGKANSKLAQSLKMKEIQPAATLTAWLTN